MHSSMNWNTQRTLPMCEASLSSPRCVSAAYRAFFRMSAACWSPIETKKSYAPLFYGAPASFLA